MFISIVYWSLKTSYRKDFRSQRPNGGYIVPPAYVIHIILVSLISLRGSADMQVSFIQRVRCRQLTQFRVQTLNFGLHSPNP